MEKFQPEGRKLRNSTCLYFPEKEAVIPEAFAKEALSPEATDDFLSRGWRHFSNYFFQDSCPDCGECKPIRLKLKDFSPSKSQRRLLKKNRETEFRVYELEDFAMQHFEASVHIYNQFVKARYNKPPSSMQEYLRSFFTPPCQTLVSAVFVEEKLIGCGFLDQGKDALSTIYFSFNTEYQHSSPGNYSILKEIEWAKEQGFLYYYLGYYIEGISSMKYKAAFKPHQLYDFKTKIWT